MEKTKPRGLADFLRENNVCMLRLIDANCKFLYRIGGGELFCALNKANANFRKLIAENEKLIAEIGGGE
jgi:hypothetical protein